MERITQFDKPTCRLVGKRIEETLKALEDELGVAINYRGGSFGAGTFTCKIDVAVRSDDGKVASREEEAFRQLASSYGLKASDLGREFRSNGATYTLVGLKPSATRFPFLGKRADGKMFKFGIDAILRALGIPDDSGDGPEGLKRLMRLG